MVKWNVTERERAISVLVDDPDDLSLNTIDFRSWKEEKEQPWVLLNYEF